MPGADNPHAGPPLSGLTNELRHLTLFAGRGGITGREGLIAHPVAP
jgi:hypothetical protein